MSTIRQHTTQSAADQAHGDTKWVNKSKQQSRSGLPEVESRTRQQEDESTNACEQASEPLQDGNSIETRAVTLTRLPGAYAAAPSAGEQPQYAGRGNPDRAPSTAVSLDIEPASVAVATEVRDDGISGVHQTAVETTDEAQRLRAINRKAKLRSAIFVVAGVMITVVVLLLLLFKLREKNDGAGESLPMLASTSQMGKMEASLLNLLPDYTIEALTDVGSPQSRAYRWILEDPYLSEYIDVEWRVLQRFALVTFYCATNGEQWLHNDSWLSYDHNECFWFSYDAFGPPPAVTGGITGIDVENANPCELDVDALNRSSKSIIPRPYKHLWFLGNQLQGTLPLEIFWLTSLRSMSVLVNELVGIMPTHIGQLTDLEALTFSRNSFTGSLPTELGGIPKLTFLDCTGNLLTGTVPSQLGLLADWEYAMMDFNYLSGTIPPELFRVSSRLIWWFLDSNPLHGTLPSEVGNLRKCQAFSMATCSLTGTIPSELGLMQSASRITLANNTLTGTIPTSIGQLAPRRLKLELEMNELTGALPSEIGLMTTLVFFFAQDNKLSGSIPVEILANVANSSSSLLVFNVTNNCLAEEDVLDSGCWVDYENMGRECTNFARTWSCGCACSCPTYNDTATPGDNHANFSV